MLWFSGGRCCFFPPNSLQVLPSYDKGSFNPSSPRHILKQDTSWPHGSQWQSSPRPPPVSLPPPAHGCFLPYLLMDVRDILAEAGMLYEEVCLGTRATTERSDTWGGDRGGDISKGCFLHWVLICKCSQEKSSGPRLGKELMTWCSGPWSGGKEPLAFLRGKVLLSQLSSNQEQLNSKGLKERHVNQKTY